MKKNARKLVAALAAAALVEAAGAAASPPPQAAAPEGFEWIARYRDSLSVAVTQIGSDNATLVIDRPVSLTEPVTVPSNISILILQGGQVLDCSKHNLTINGTFKAPLLPCFDGVVTFGRLSLTELYPEWFRAPTDDPDDDTPALQRTLSAADARDCPSTVALSKSKVYRLTDHLVCLATNPLKITGGGELWFDGLDLPDRAPTNPGVTHCILNIGPAFLPVWPPWQPQTDPDDITTGIRAECQNRRTGLVIQGITIRSNSDYYTVPYDEKTRKNKAGGILVWQMDDVQVRDCLFKNIDHEGLILIGCRYADIPHNIFRDSGFSAVGGWASDFTITDNILSRVSRLFEGTGLRAKIAHNQCDSLSYGGISMGEGF